jgi:hypothetical protein
MALRDWQAALGQLVEARSSGRDADPVLASLEGRALTVEERRWLREVGGSPGFALTAEVPQWWRHQRVGRAARLTLMALGARADAVLREYLRDVPCFTLFFIAEGLSFLEYVARTVTAPHVRPVAELEHALWTVKLAAPVGGGTVPELAPGAVLERHPAAACILFDAPPEAVLGALLKQAPLPEPEARSYPVLVAPGVPGLWRPATPEEASVFAAGAAGTPLDATGALPEGSADVVAALRMAGALRLRETPGPGSLT